jgi:HK97 family phage prohead protease
MPDVLPSRRILFTADARLKFSLAADGAPGKIGTLKGYALLWNVLSSDRGGYKVRLLPGSAAFATPTMALFNHDQARVLGSTANGTLRTSSDDTGVAVEIDLPDTTDGRDAVCLVRDGYVTGMSFAMTGNPQGDVTTEAGQQILNAKSYTVDEVTITAIPSFTQTSVTVADPEDEPDYSVRREHSLKFQTLRFSALSLPK